MKMRKQVLVVLLSLMSVWIFSNTVLAQDAGTMLNPARTWVVLMEQNTFPKQYTSLQVDFINSLRMKETLVKLGVPETQILEVRDTLKIKDVEEVLRWFKEKSQEGDTIIYYIATHGSWMRYELTWNSWVPKEWAAIEGRHKLLIVNSCLAGDFIRLLHDNTDGIALGTVAEAEYGWWGIAEEKLPIIGDVWTYYFVQAIFDPKSDANKDGFISVEEAFTATIEKNQKYMKEKVFKVRQFAKSFRDLGADIKKPYPTPQMIDTLPGEFLLFKLP